MGRGTAALLAAMMLVSGCGSTSPSGSSSTESGEKKDTKRAAAAVPIERAAAAFVAVPGYRFAKASKSERTAAGFFTFAEDGGKPEVRRVLRNGTRVALMTAQPMDPSLGSVCSQRDMREMLAGDDDTVATPIDVAGQPALTARAEGRTAIIWPRSPSLLVHLSGDEDAVRRFARELVRASGRARGWASRREVWAQSGDASGSLGSRGTLGDLYVGPVRVRWNIDGTGTLFGVFRPEDQSRGGPRWTEHGTGSGTWNAGKLDGAFDLHTWGEGDGSYDVTIEELLTCARAREKQKRLGDERANSEPPPRDYPQPPAPPAPPDY